MDNLIMSATITSQSAAFVLSQSEVNAIIIFLVAVALVVVLQPLILSVTFRKRREKSTNSNQEDAPSFFEIPYITWFLVHYGVATIAIIAIVILGLDQIIDKSTVAALLGSLFGYVLGSSSKGSSSTPPPKKPEE